MKQFSDRLRYARKFRKLSQTELARASGLSQGAISSYETGTRRTTTGLIQLAQALRVNPAWLITGAGSMELEPATDTTPPSFGLQDVRSPHPVSATWPFPGIKPGDFWVLPEPQRHAIEQTVAALITAMHQQGDKD